MTVKATLISLMIGLFSMTAWAAEKKDADIKMEKQPTGLKLLFPNSFASSHLLMGYANRDSESIGLAGNATYNYRLAVGSTFLDGRWYSQIRGDLRRGIKSREITLGNTRWRNKLKVWSNDYFSSTARIDTYFPTSQGSTRTNNYLNLDNSASYKFATAYGNFMPGVNMTVSHHVRATKVFRTVKPAANKANLVTEAPEREEVKPTDLEIDPNFSLGYTNNNLKGFYTSFSYGMEYSVNANGNSSTAQFITNFSSYSLSKNWSLYNYFDFRSNSENEFNGFEKGMGGLYDEVALNYSF